MSLVKKITIGVAALVILTLLLMPLFISFWLQKNYPKFIANINRQNTQMAVKLKKFNRGWFHSSAVVTYYPAAHPHNDAYAVTTQQKFSQGPVILTQQKNKTKFNFALALVQTNSKDIKAMHSLHALITFRGNIHTFAHVKNANLKIPENGMRLAIKDLKLNSTASIFANQVTANLTAKKVLMTSERDGQKQQSILLNNITIATKQQNLNTVPTGFVNIDAKKIIIKNNSSSTSKPNLSLTNLNIRTQNQAEQNKVTSNLNIGIASIKTLNQPLLGPAKISVNVKNADADAIYRLRSFLQQEKEQTLTEQQMNATTKRLIFNVLSKGITVKINNASIANKENQASLQANLIIPKLKQESAMNEIFRKHDLTAKITISQYWLASLLKLSFDNFGVSVNLQNDFYRSQIIPILIKNNLIKSQSNNTYYTTLQVKNGKITVFGSKQSEQQLSQTIADVLNAISTQSQESVNHKEDLNTSTNNSKKKPTSAKDAESK